MIKKKEGQTGTVKLVFLLLSVGGAVGILFGVWTQVTQLVQSGMKPSVLTAVMGTFILVFGLSTWTGIDLWRGKERAYRLAKILFAAQIPQISLPGFAYHFYTGLMLSIAYSQETASKLGFEFQLGSSTALWISREIENLILGVNIIPVLALICLVRSKQPTTKNEDNFGLI